MVKLRIIWLIFLQHIVDGSQQYSSNGNDGLLVSLPLFQSKVTAADFRKLLGPNGAQSALDKQRLDIGPAAADSSGLFLPGTLVVLRRKSSPGAKVLRGGEHRHIHSDFRNDANCGKGLDIRSRCHKVELRKIFLCGGQDQRLQVELAQFQSIHVGTDDAELFSLLDTHLSVHRCLAGALMPLVRYGVTAKGSLLSRRRVVIAEAALPKTSENTSSSLILETVRQFWTRFFSPVVKLVSFP